MKTSVLMCLSQIVAVTARRHRETAQVPIMLLMYPRLDLNTLEAGYQPSCLSSECDSVAL